MEDTMEMVSYDKPEIADYGDLQELTAHQSGPCSDFPPGSPANHSCA